MLTLTNEQGSGRRVRFETCVACGVDGLDRPGWMATVVGLIERAGGVLSGGLTLRTGTKAMDADEPVGIAELVLDLRERVPLPEDVANEMIGNHSFGCEPDRLASYLSVRKLSEKRAASVSVWTRVKDKNRFRPQAECDPSPEGIISECLYVNGFSIISASSQRANGDVTSAFVAKRFKDFDAGTDGLYAALQMRLADNEPMGRLCTGWVEDLTKHDEAGDRLQCLV